MTKMQVVRELAQSDWREYVDKTPLGNIFHTPEMFQVFARAKGYQPALWAVVDSSGEPLALMQPVQVVVMDGLMRRLSSRAVLYGSVLCSPGPVGHEALALLLKEYRHAHGTVNLFTECRNLSDLTEIQPILNDAGFAYEDHLNFLIDLKQSEEEIWGRIQSDARYRIRRELRRGVMEIVTASTPEHLRDSYRLLQMTYAHAQIPLADHSLFQAIYDILCPQQMARISIAYCEGAPASAVIDLHYKGVVYGFYGGTDRTYRSHSPAEMVEWNSIKAAKEQGFTLYDFGGAGKPDEEYGVRDYKAKFGGDLVNFGRNVCVHSPRLLNLSKQGYEIYRRLMPANKMQG